MYNAVGLINPDDYYPIIENDTLALTWRNKIEKDINFLKDAEFYIVLKENMENIGNIGYSFSLEDTFLYTGNVHYEIKEDFRNKGYVTMALNLLKDIVKNINIKNKDLYISAFSDNIPSIKVAIKNGGELVYDGELPDQDFCLLQDANHKNKHIKIYRIKI